MEAQAIADEDAEMCRSIGTHGVEIIRDLSAGVPLLQLPLRCCARWAWRGLDRVVVGDAACAFHPVASQPRCDLIPGIPSRLCAAKNGETVNIMTHCNAGWLAFVDYGSATSPMYQAFDEGPYFCLPASRVSRLAWWLKCQSPVRLIELTALHPFSSALRNRHSRVGVRDAPAEPGWPANRLGAGSGAMVACVFRRRRLCM